MNMEQILTKNMRFTFDMDFFMSIMPHLNNQRRSDVTFKVGKDSKVIHGHEFLLETVSEVFAFDSSH